MPKGKPTPAPRNKREAKKQIAKLVRENRKALKELAKH